MQFAFFVVLAALTGAESSADIVTFKDREVLVYDSDGIPLFRGKRDFVLRVARNPTGEVVTYDAATRRVRVSKVGTELWLHCAELEPMAASCPQAANNRSRSGAIRGGDDPASSTIESRADIPSCPGDIRCPKLVD